MRKLLRFLVLGLLLTMSVLVAKVVSAQEQPDVSKIIEQEFGPQFKMMPGFTPMFGDFNGDGQEDIAVVVKGDNPLMGQGKYHYVVGDPYNESFGYGNAKVTMTFNASADGNKFLLIAHTWKAPKDKFVLVNIAMKEARVGQMELKKKELSAVEVQEENGTQAAVYWDAKRKKYRWEAIGMKVD